MRWRSLWIRRRARRGLLVVEMEKVRVFDPVAGGEALLVIDVGSVCLRWHSSRTRRRARGSEPVVVTTE